MKGVPPEIDQLMWSLAEESNQRAIDEFGERYPQHRGELMRRMAMVASLRGAQPGTKTAVSGIPHFRPTELRPTPPSPRLQLVVGAMMVAAIVMAGYTAYQFIQPPAGKPVMVVKPNLAPPTLPDVMPQAKPEAGPEPEKRVDEKLIPVRDPESTQPVDSRPGYLKPKNVKLNDVDLTVALKMVAAEAGLKVEIAPLFEDRKVSVEYHDMNTIDILKAMGKEFEFTPFDQGDGTVLIVPAVDKGAKIGGDVSGDPARKISG